jgi:cyclophilin family peptidyl-prolyl cis-trans isomerase
VNRRLAILGALAGAAFATTLAAFPAIAQTANPRVEFKTNRGAIVIEVFQDKSPKSAANFLQYVKDGHYKGTIFHRVIDGFVVQGGGFDAKMTQKSTRAPIANEASNGIKNDRGTLAMARTSDPNSATSQFYINLSNNDALNFRGPGSGYAVFGRVVQGMDVVDKIAKSPTGNVGPFQDVPREPIVVESAAVVAAK